MGQRLTALVALHPLIAAYFAQTKDLCMTLLAYWHIDGYPGIELPYAVYFDDGTPAPMELYLEHIEATHEEHTEFPGTIVRRIYTHIVGGVYWSFDDHDWKVTGRDVPPFLLGFHDPDATDDQIVAELYLRPVVYRCVVIRPDLVTAIPASCPSRLPDSHVEIVF